MKYTKQQCEKKIAKWQKRLEECELAKGWYKDDVHEKWLMYFDGENFVFGFNWLGEWTVLNATFKGDGNEILATEKEVEQALIKEAERRGFKEGVKFINVGTEDEVVYFKGNYRFYFSPNQLCNNVGSVFYKGKWAEIIKEPVYEYQWLIHELEDDVNKVTSKFYKNEEEIFNKLCRYYYEAIKPIEETKRLRK